MRQAVKSSKAEEFVALVTDGWPIDGYGASDRKDKFGRLGKAVLKELAKLLGEPPRSVRFNPAGPALSGDVVLSTDKLYISMSHRGQRNAWGDFFMRFEALGERPVWWRWEKLLDLPRLAESIKRYKAGARIEKKAVG